MNKHPVPYQNVFRLPFGTDLLLEIQDTPFSIVIVIIANRILQKPNKFIHRTEKRVLKKSVKFYIKFEKYSQLKTFFS